MILGDRIKARLQAVGWSQADLARAIGVSPQAVSKIALGGTQETPKLYQIARFLKTTPEYLQGETDDPAPASDNREAVTQASLLAAGRDDIVSVAMIDFAYGMGGSFLSDSPEVRLEAFPLSFIRHFTTAPAEQLVIAEGIGDSMAPTIGPNDLVLIDRAAMNLNINDRIWACAIGEIGMVKRLRSRGDGVAILSDNPNVPDDHAADGELHIIGRVVGKFSRL